MHIKGIIFDLDGTLANTLPICIKAYQQVYEHFTGRAFSEQEVTAHFGLTEEGAFQRVIPEHWEEGFKLFFETYKKLHVECPAPFPGITQALQLLRERGILMSVVTGKGAHTAAYTLKYLGLAPYFEHVEVGDANAIVKAMAIRRILADWQMDPYQAAYIGDAYTDIEQAKTAGVLPLGAAWCSTQTLSYPGAIAPAVTFATVDSFIDWLDANIQAI
jgi:pyrophosphatase PpaX